MEPRQVYTEAIERMRRAVRRSPAELRRTQLDQAAGLLAGRVGCRLDEAQAQLAHLAAEQGRDVHTVAASVIGLLEAGGSPDTAQPVAQPGGQPATHPAGQGSGPAAQRLAGLAGQWWGGTASQPRAPAGAPGGWPQAVQPVLDTLPGAVALLRPVRDGRIVDYVIEAASPEAEDVLGRRGAQLVGLQITDAYAIAADSDLWRAYEQVLVSGEPQVVPLVYRGRGGATPARAGFSVRIHRLGDRLMVCWIHLDEEVRQADRLAQTERLGNLGWAEWDLLTGRTVWSDQLFRIFERDPADGTMSTEEIAALGVPEDLPIRAATAEAFVRGERVDVVYRYRISGRVKHLRSVVDAVRDATGRPLKIYGIVQDVTAREQALRRLAEVENQLAEHRRTLAAEHELAARLQQIILPIPRAPIELPGVRVALRYLPAEQLSHVGGDWYHAGALTDGTVLLAVGDVAGHGLPAATTMAQVRHALRALTVTTTDPAKLLSCLNRLMCDLADETPAATGTAVVARYDPATRSLTWAQAGHPAPLRTRDGITRALPRPYGMMLGARRQARYQPATVTLAQDDVLLLYTDGLVEHRGHSLDDGLAAVIGTIDEAVASSPAEPLTAMLRRLRRANPDDDTCVLAAQPTADAHGSGGVAPPIPAG